MTFTSATWLELHFPKPCPRNEPSTKMADGVAAILSASLGQMLVSYGPACQQLLLPGRQSKVLGLRSAGWEGKRMPLDPVSGRRCNGAVVGGLDIASGASFSCSGRAGARLPSAPDGAGRLLILSLGARISAFAVIFAGSCVSTWPSTASRSPSSRFGSDLRSRAASVRTRIGDADLPGPRPLRARRGPS
jgi:hypothetical protein